MITKCWSEQRETRWDIRTVVHQLSVSSIQEVAEGQRGNRPAPQTVTQVEGAGLLPDVQMIPRSLEVAEEPTPLPRRATFGAQLSAFVEGNLDTR
jgi:hypothetical protein